MSGHPPTLGGVVCIRNGEELDFCWRQSVQSLLPVCDEIVICDGESTDGTQGFIRDWAAVNPKIKVCVYKWPDPKGDVDFWVKWLNYGREHLSTDWHFQLDADEILHENSYEAVSSFKYNYSKRSAMMTRYNFWGDHRHTAPPGVLCGHRVIRMAPTNMWMASDGDHPMGREVAALQQDTKIEIFHYGFIRKPKAFFKKEELLQNYFFNSYDPRLKEAETYDGNWMLKPGMVDWVDKLEPYNGSHPEVIQKWLNERGYKT